MFQTKSIVQEKINNNPYLFINLVFAFLPISFIIGSLIINVHVLLFCCLGIYYLKSQILRTKFDLTSPRAMVDQLRTEGHMVYINKTNNGTSYRLGTPTKSILAAGAARLFKLSLNEVVAAGIRALYGKQKYAYSNQ